jgi:xylan 1,4-beta-xylosidase
MRYANPVLTGFYPDPSVCRVGADYYLVNSSMECFPGVPISHSRDLIHWRQIGNCLTRSSQLALGRCVSSAGILAPTLRHHAGVFYLITTNVAARGNFFVTARDPAGPWSEPLWLEADGIDPSLFFDEDGRVYFTCQSRDGAMQSTIDLETGRLQSPLRVIWPGTGGAYPEAPHLYHINGVYYLMMSEGGTEYGHMVTIARSASPWGPFESCPRNPVMTHRSNGVLPIQSVGHADLVQAPDGRWWAVCLGVRPNGYPPCHHLGRETFLAPVAWDADGWPVMGRNGRIDLEMEIPGWQEQPWEQEPIRDEFDERELHPRWNFLRNPHAEDWSLTERPGSLRLKGSAVTLDDVDSPAWVGRRQQHFDCEVWTALDFAPQNDGEEAGLSVRTNETHHYEIAITREESELCLIVRRRIGSLRVVTAKVVLNGSHVQLGLRADKDTYTFGYREDDRSEPHWLASGETRYLSTEVAGGFTGVYLGVYSTGSGRPCVAPADFEWFDYTPGACSSTPP